MTSIALIVVPEERSSGLRIVISQRVAVATFQFLIIEPITHSIYKMTCLQLLSKVSALRHEVYLLLRATAVPILYDIPSKLSVCLIVL